MSDRLIWNLTHGIKKSRKIVPLDDCVKQFNRNNWSKLNTIKRMRLLEQTMNSYCNSIGIKNKPRLFYSEIPNSKATGKYNNLFNVIVLNMTNLNNPYKALDTIVHESNHAYQKACVKNTLNAVNRYSDEELNSLKTEYGYQILENSFTERDSYFTAAKFVIGNDKTYRADYVHTLGNLTITGYNQNLSNMSFEQKKDRKSKDKKKEMGYRNGLFLNKDVVKEDSWTINKIQKRTDKIVGILLKMYGWDAG